MGYFFSIFVLMKKQYFNDQGRDVSEYIETNRTQFFTNIFFAIREAIKIHSYYYELMDSKGERVGWGVPQ